MTLRCDKHKCKLVKRRHGSGYIWKCPHSHAPIKQFYSDSNLECKNCHRQLPNKFAHVNGC
jgi:hypothetical protein